MSKKLSLVNTSATSLKAVWECFIISKTSKCVSDATLSNYHHHLRAIAKHLNIEMPLEELSKSHLESMVVSMRAAGLAHNTVATYLRVINTFLNWASREGLTSVSIPNIKEKDTVKETYTDAELMLNAEVDPFFHFLSDFISIQIINIQNIHVFFSDKPSSLERQ